MRTIFVIIFGTTIRSKAPIVQGEVPGVITSNQQQRSRGFRPLFQQFWSSLQQAIKAIIVASTKRPVYARKNLQLVQVNTIRMLSSLIKYNAALVMVVCNPRHLSFVTCWICYPYFFVEACWHGYLLAYWSHGIVIGDGSFSSALINN